MCACVRMCVYVCTCVCMLVCVHVCVCVCSCSLCVQMDEDGDALEFQAVASDLIEEDPKETVRFIGVPEEKTTSKETRLFIQSFV